MKRRILIGADIVPTKTNVELFINGDARTLLGEELYSFFSEADYRIFNLETPLSDINEPILKSGPNLSAPKDAINGYRAMGVDLLTVANNHTLDQGKRAFLETLRTLDECGISHVGGGITKDEAKAIHIIEFDGKKIGIFAVCEHEFSWIEDYGVGTNGFDYLTSLDDVAEASANVDYLVVLYHGGREHYPYPSPLLRKVCRRIADKGADLILCQHSHCIGAKEIYNGCEILYGQGNVLFDSENSKNVPCWQTGLIAELALSDGEFSVNYIPVEKRGATIALSHNAEIIRSFNERSEEILSDGFVESRYLQFVKENKQTFDGYISHFSNAASLGTKHGAATRNIINCDPHREFIITYLTELHNLK